MARIISLGDQSIKNAPHTPDQIVEGLKQKNTIKAFREKLQGMQFGLAVEIEVRQTDAGRFCETQKALDPSLLLLVPRCIKTAKKLKHAQLLRKRKCLPCRMPYDGFDPSTYSPWSCFLPVSRKPYGLFFCLRFRAYRLAARGDYPGFLCPDTNCFNSYGKTSGGLMKHGV